MLRLAASISRPVRTSERLRLLNRTMTTTPNRNDQPANPRARLQPRIFPTSGFETVAESTRFEEQMLSYYDRHTFYPVQIGEVLNEHYQVVAKLGWGTTSTVWLAHDLEYGPRPSSPVTHS